MGFGDAIPKRSIISLLAVCKYFAQEEIRSHGINSEIEWETRYRQIFEYDLGDGIRITVMNLVGKVVLWRELRTVLQGLEQYLEGWPGREVMFRFRCGPAGEVGWGWIASGKTAPARMGK